jgi:GAF domain-containing protein
MDNLSLRDKDSRASTVAGNPARAGTIHSSGASVSAAIAAANAQSVRPAVSESDTNAVRPAASDSREHGENGHSLAQLAYRDLDAALQLLADRAQYITGANGAAIALRHGEQDDMLCRASAGSNAPELGALLSIEYGLSGECVRTRQLQRCDDAPNDSRVNREACRQLGIASVLVMPILRGEQALGVFELFSGKRYAFDERDISALQRLSAMVELTVKFAMAAQAPTLLGKTTLESETVTLKDEGSLADRIACDNRQMAEPGLTGKHTPGEAPTTISPANADESVTVLPGEKSAIPDAEPQPPQGANIGSAAKKSFFWSAPSVQKEGIASTADQPASSASAPLVLRNLHKCRACGFPVSQGRTLCVECEEKHWRGQPQTGGNGKPEGTALTQKNRAQKNVSTSMPGAVSDAPTGKTAAVAASHEGPAQSLREEIRKVSPDESSVNNNPSPIDNAMPILASGLETESWLAANKYVLVMLLVIAIAIAAFAFLR